MTLDDINNEFDEYQKTLTEKEKHLKLLVKYNDNNILDDMLDMIKERTLLFL